MGRFMKSLITISLLALSMSSFSCPDLSGTYLCPEKIENGEVYPAYTIKLEQLGNTVKSYLNGSPADTIVADGSTFTFEDGTPAVRFCTDDSVVTKIEGTTGENGEGFKIETISSMSLKNGDLFLENVMKLHLPIGTEEMISSEVCQRI